MPMPAMCMSKLTWIDSKQKQKQQKGLGMDGHGRQ